MPQILCENLTLGYNEKAVVENLSFSVSKGDYLCVVGENGVGKSTLIKTLLGLLPPIRGKIALGDDLLPKEIGYLPQQSDTQRDFPASVSEVVLSGCLNRCGIRPFYRKAEKALAEDNMARLDILPLKKKCYRELSGGQQQRVLLARALCATRRMLLLDEPVSGLDPIAAQEMYALIRALNRENGISVIMITHDIASAIPYASHILHIAHKPLFFGEKDDYMQTEIGRRFLSETGGVQNG